MPSTITTITAKTARHLSRRAAAACPLRSTLVRLAAPLPCAVLALLLPLPLSAATVSIGTGAGTLDYPKAQETLKLQPGDTLRIAAGTYSGIALSNLAGTAAAPITVSCAPMTTFAGAGESIFANLAFIHFEGFRITEGPVWHVTGASHDLSFRAFTVGPRGGFVIYDPAKVFDGTRASAFANFTWEDCAFTGAGIRNSDWSPVSNLKSLLLDFDIHRCTFTGYDAGTGPVSVLGFDKCFNLQVHDCRFSDIGVSKLVIGHDAVIVGSGYFKVYNNTFTRHWANDVRMFPMKLHALGYDGADAVTRYYNNISWEKRKYPAFEQNCIHAEEFAKSGGLFDRTGSEILFNTLYRSRRAAKSGDPYVAQLVDVYAPDVVVKHNLIIEPDCDMPFDAGTDYVCHYGAGPQSGIVVENNLVFRSWAEAGLVDTMTFAPGRSSPARDAATGTVPYITLDHDGHPRYVGAAADVGAVESQEARP